MEWREEAEGFNFWYHEEATSWCTKRDGRWSGWHAASAAAISLPGDSLRITERSSASDEGWFPTGRTNLAFNELDAILLSGNGRQDAFLYSRRHADATETISTWDVFLCSLQRACFLRDECAAACGDRVLLCVQSAMDAIYWIQGCKRMGYVYVCAAGQSGVHAVVLKYEDAACLVAVTDREDVSRCCKPAVLLPASLIDVSGVSSVAEGWELAAPVPLDASHPALIMYTSGSTGRPKGIVHVHGGWMVGVRCTARLVLGLGAGTDRLFCVASPAWITGQAYMITAALLTSSLSLVVDGSPVAPMHRFVSLIEAHKIQVLKAGSTFMRMFMTNPGQQRILEDHDVSSLRLGLFCAEPVNRIVHQFAVDHFTPNFIVCYWATEHGGIVFGELYRSDRVVLQLAQTRALPWIEAAVVAARGDGKLVVCDTGELGDVAIRNSFPHMGVDVWDTEAQARGEKSERWHQYYREESRDGSRLYIQGDLCTRDSTGGYTFHGRSDEVINVGGNRLGSCELENGIVETDPAIADCAVVGYPDPIFGTVPCAFVVLTEASHRPSLSIKHYVVDALPKTFTGKIMRGTLRRMLHHAPIAREGMANPSCIESLTRELKCCSLFSRVELIDMRWQYTCQMDDLQPLCRGHVIQGRTLLPAALFLILLYHAIGKGTALRQFRILQPVVMCDEADPSCRLELDIGAEGSASFIRTFREATPSEGRREVVVHATFVATTVTPDTSDARQEMATLSSPTARDELLLSVEKAELIYAAFEAIGISYGPLYQRTVGYSVDLSGRRRRARVSARANSTDPHAEVGGHVDARDLNMLCHPAILDASIQARILGRTLQLPYSVDLVRFCDHVPATAEGTEDVVYHAEILDDDIHLYRDGTQLVSMFGCVFVSPEDTGTRSTASAPPKMASATSATPTEHARAVDASEVFDYAASIVKDKVGYDVGLDVPLMDAGVNSMLAVRVTAELGAAVNRVLHTTLLFDYPTIRLVAQHLCETNDGEADAPEEGLVDEDPSGRFPTAEMPLAYQYGMAEGVSLRASHRMYFENTFTHFDARRYETAWSSVLHRHAAFRVRLHDDGTSQVCEYEALNIETHDWREMQAHEIDNAHAELRARLMHEAAEPPYTRHRIVLLPCGRTIVCEYFSGLAVDAQSLTHAKREAFTLYHCPTASLPPVSVLSFKQYVCLEHASRASSRGKECRSWWSNRISQLPPALEIPGVVQPGQTGAYMTRKTVCIAKREWARCLHKFSSTGTSASLLFYLLLTEVWGLWSREASFTVGILVSRRLPLHRSVSDVLGNFYSVFPFGVDVSTSILERARALQADLSDAMRYRWCSGIDVMGEWNRTHPDSIIGGVPYILSSGLSATYSEAVPASLLHGTGSQTYMAYTTPQTLIDVIANMDESGAVVLSVMSAADHFDSATLAEMAAVIPATVERATDGRTIGIACLTAATQMAIEAAWPVEVVTPGPLHSSLMQWQESTNLAVGMGEVRYSFADVHSRSRHVAALLVGCHANPNVAVIMPKHPDVFPFVFGILYAGCAYVPIDTQLPDDRKLAIVQDADINTACAEESSTHLPVTFVLARDLCGMDGTDLPPLQIATAAEVAYIIYTSGSTGTPKGVVLGHDGPWNTCVDVVARYGVCPSDVIFGISSLSFDLSVFDIFGSAMSGASVVYPEDARSPATWIHCIQQNAVTIWNSAPALLDVFLDSLPEQSLLPHVRLVMLSGDWIPLSLPGRAKKAMPNARVLSLGGATEASIWSIWYEVDSVLKEWNSIPYGFAMTNQAWRVLDTVGRDLPVGVMGELWIGGVGLALGYVGDDAKTQERFRTLSDGRRWYKTGDLGRRDGDGCIHFMGRMDSQVKIGGFRVELGEIENVALLNEGVERAVASATDGREDRKLLFFYVGTCGEREVQDTLSAKLPRYMLPHSIQKVASIPLTKNGKVDHRGLREGHAAGLILRRPLPSASLSNVCRDAKETALLTQWRRFSGMDDLSSIDSFFDNGGTSLRAMQLAIALTKTGDWGKVSIRDIVNSATARAFYDSNRGTGIQLQSGIVTIRAFTDATKHVFVFVHDETGDGYQFMQFYDILEHATYGMEYVPGTDLSDMSRMYMQRVDALGIRKDVVVHFIGKDMGIGIACDMHRQMGRQGRLATITALQTERSGELYEQFSRTLYPIPSHAAETSAVEKGWQTFRKLHLALGPFSAHEERCKRENVNILKCVAIDTERCHLLGKELLHDLMIRE